MTAPRLFLCAAALASWLAGGGDGFAQAAAPGGAAPERVEVSVAAGLFLPTEDSVGRVYDGTRVPWSVDGDVRVAGRLSAFAGFRSLTMDGRASGFDPASGISIDTTLSSRSLLLGVRVHHRWGRLGVFAGGGAAWTSFTETWPGLDAEVSGSAGARWSRAASSSACGAGSASSAAWTGSGRRPARGACSTPASTSAASTSRAAWRSGSERWSRPDQRLTG